MKFAALTSVAILGAAAAHATALTWEGALKLTQENNSALNAATAALRASELQTKSSRGVYFPQVSAGLNYSQYDIPAVGGPYTASISVTENLFNGLIDSAKVDQARANENVQVAALKGTQAQITFNVKSAFENLLFAKASLELSYEISKRRAQNLRLVQLRFKNGGENQGSVLLYEAYLKDAKFSELQGKHAQGVARAQLAQAIGTDEVSSLDVTGALPAKNPPDAIDAKNLAVGTPNFLKAVAQASAASAGVVVARGNFFPTLSVSAGTSKAGPRFPETGHWSFGVNLNVPLFYGGRDYYATRAAVELRSAADFTVVDTARQVVAALEQNYDAFTEAVERLGVDQSYLDAAELRAEIARADYGNGLISFQDWDLAETDLISRQRSILQSEQARVIAEASWELALGKGAWQ